MGRLKGTATLWPASFVMAALAFLSATPSHAQVEPRRARTGLPQLMKADPRLRPRPNLDTRSARAAMNPRAQSAWDAFETRHAGRWRATLDRRTGHVNIAEGSGAAWVPGRGNRLETRDVAAFLHGRAKPDTNTLEAIARDFIPTVEDLLGTEGRVLRRNAASGPLSDFLWNVDFDVYTDEGLRIDGAHVFFRVNNGNLIQWGSEGLPAVDALVPSARYTRQEALERVGDYVGGLSSRDIFFDKGTELVVPVQNGTAVELMRVWQFGFVRQGGHETWTARVDASTGEVVEFVDANKYASQVTGGAWPVSWRVDGTQQAMTTYGWPFAKLSPSSSTTNSSGIYTWDGTAQTNSLNSGNPYVNIASDTCGTSSQTTDGSGNLDWGTFGAGGARDCEIVGGSGGAGNTASAHQQYYHVNKIMEKGRTYLPSNTWLQGAIPVNVNIASTCNAFWNGSSLNFYKSGGGCSNTGEDAGISMHEWGHGMDSNDGNGSSTDNGTGETYGDFSAALQTRDSCVGQGFIADGSACGGYGNACTVCDGVRDIDWGRHSTKQPWTVNGFTKPDCPGSTTYEGPCGEEGHCESYVSSGALYDFAAYDLSSGCSNRPGLTSNTYPDWGCLADGTGSGGPYTAAAAWQVVDRLWYLSRATANQAFTCNTGGTWTSDGCNAGSNWTTMRAADDDDGDLTNGTPHSCQMAAAFGRHGIACTTDTSYDVCFRGCTPPAQPTLDAPVGASYQVGLSWSGTSGYVVDVYRNEVGCNAGFTRIANDLSGTSYTDTGVANGTTYYYQITSQPTGNEACASVTSVCRSVTPSCSAPATPTGVSATATGENQITITFGTNGAVSYDVLRATVSGGPYTVIATVTTGSHVDTTVTGGVRYYYVVRANGSGTSCSSASSSEVSAVTTGDCTQAPTFSGAQSVTALGNGQGCGLRVAWNAGTSNCSSNLVYNVYRSTTSGFTPGSGNLLKSCVTGTAYDDTTPVTGTAYYYKVRAEDPGSPGAGLCGAGTEETNTTERSGATGTGTAMALVNFDSTTAASVPSGWSRGTFSGSTNWYGALDCSPNSSASNILRFGESGTGAKCSKDYAINTDAVVYTFTAVPAGATDVTWSFTHRWSFETNWDGGRLVVSTDGATFYRIASNTYLSGQQYTGAIDDDGTVRSFTGTTYNTSMLSTSVNLSQFCTDNAAAGFNINCAGQTIYIGFEGYSDPSVTEDGWYVDNVTVTYGTACSGTAPSPVTFLTATGKDAQVTAQWLNPSSYVGPTRICGSTTSLPANPGTTACPSPVNATGSASSVGVTTFTGLTNGTTNYLAAFVNDGAGIFSARKTSLGYPMSTSGNAKWNFSTAAAALATPYQSSGIGIFAGSNDRILYSLAAGATGGTWPAGFSPATMNGPAQSQPMVLPGSYMPFAHNATFVSSQDGHLYCFNSGTGAGCTDWPSGGRSATDMGMLQATPILHDDATAANRLLLVGTRNSGGANGVYAIKPADGTTATNWPFTNTVGQGSLDGGQAIGIISSAGNNNPTARRFYFGSRVSSGGSAYTIWAIDYSSGSPVLSWARGPVVGTEAVIGNVDGAVTRNQTNGNLLVGTVNGEVIALNPADGSTVWRRSFGDGPVKTYVSYSAADQRIRFATTSKVWAIPADGSTGSDWSVTAFSPTRPFLHFGTTRTYVGACTDATCASGRLIELDNANSWASPKTYDIAGAGGLGDVIIDRGQSPALAHMGSRSGRVFAVQVPLP